MTSQNPSSRPSQEDPSALAFDSSGWPVIQGISSHESCWRHTEATEILKVRLRHKGPRITSSRPLFIITSCHCQWNAAHALPLPFPSPTVSCLSLMEEPWLPKDDVMTTHCKALFNSNYSGVSISLPKLQGHIPVTLTSEVKR